MLLEQKHDQKSRKLFCEKNSKENMEMILSDHADILNCPTPELVTSTDLARGGLLTSPNLPDGRSMARGLEVIFPRL